MLMPILIGLIIILVIGVPLALLAVDAACKHRVDRAFVQQHSQYKMNKSTALRSIF